ncbi:MAG TPA: serine/threonine-protein kinase [Polyangiaceae bacterium]|nr:serine/threonine-protein kinase [Polyangiaceae bacterium]
MVPLSLREGSLFAGRYRVLRRIATGGMGDVYEAIHIETNRRRALKVLQSHALTSPTLRERFHREARVTANIDSEFLVDVFDAGFDEATGTPFLVMDLLRGEDLKDRLKRQGRFSPADVITYLHQTALALEKTHRAGVVHRDLKPSNIFLTEREDGSPRIKVLDFGIAKILAGEGAHPNTTHEMMGTPYYMAVEQFRMEKRVTFAADIYSLGMIAYTFLTGHPYWKAEHDERPNILLFAQLAMHGPKEPATVRALRAGIRLPHAFDAWFARATAVAPEARFQSALAAVLALADALGVPRPGRATAPSNPFDTPPPPRLSAEAQPPSCMSTDLTVRRAPFGSSAQKTVPLRASPGQPRPRMNGNIDISGPPTFSSAKTLRLRGAVPRRRRTGIAGAAALAVTAAIVALFVALAPTSVPSQSTPSPASAAESVRR